MKCSKCQCETFKAKVRWKQVITEFPELTPVTLICSKCGHNLKVYIVKEDMKYIKRKLENIEGIVDEINDVFQTITITSEKKVKNKKRRFWQR